ncbi:MAG: hypothetical protein K9N62_14715 [Verrucomicrobia bacterium]|nr:hypothetical protein [Verrucomicrobiota bacterium]
MVRDEMGNPLSVENAFVILETSADRSIVAQVLPGIEPGVNYRLTVPVDAGATMDLYRRNAMTGHTPFSLRVQIGAASYLPIEMSGVFPQLGESARSQRIDLTLGVDSDGDGLPDAWERALLAVARDDLSDIDPNADSDQDGLSNLEEYRAGTFAYDKDDGFSLRVIGVNEQNMSLEFMSIRGRTYRVFGSSDLNEWSAMNFRRTGEANDGTPRGNLLAEATGVIQVVLDQNEDAEPMRFFKLKVE